MTLDTGYRNLMRARLCVLSLICTALAACNIGREDAAAEASNAFELLQADRIPEAREAIVAAIAKRDDEPEYHLIRGRIEMAINDWESAYNAYSDALALDSNNMEALQAVSQLGLRTGRIQQSRQATETILLLSPGDAQALATMGLHLLIRSRLEEAEKYADRALDVDQGNEGGAILKARIEFGRGNVGAAHAVLDRFEELKGENASIALVRLEMARASRDASAMAEQFQALRRMQYEDPQLQLDEADLAFKTGRTNDGLALTTDLLSQPAVSRAAVTAIIGLWREYGIVELKPAEVHAMVETGGSTARVAAARYLAERGLVAQARSLVTGLSGWDKAALDGYFAALGGNMRAASSILNRVLGEDPNNCIALISKAAIDVDDGAIDIALRGAQRAATQCPDDSAAWSLAANAYSRLGDDVNAKRLFRQGIEANPQSSYLTERFAEWLQQRGHDGEALATARRLTQNAPALLSGWRLYREVCRKANHSCADKAQDGLADARTRFGIDPLPGERLTTGLFGRLELR